MLNRVFGLLLLIWLLPIFVIIALVIYIEDGGPVIFQQNRVGRNNRVFKIYKFRTMRKDTPHVATALLDDPSKYVLKSGSILRKLSLDELPNLFNIIIGEMVFVGPRPVVRSEYDLLSMRTEMNVNTLKPGITGWAQVNGRDDLGLEEKVDYEKEYLEQKSIWFDAKIIIKTFVYVVSSRGISH